VRAPRPDGATGSILVEVLVGIGLLAILTSTLATFSRSWHSASEASAVRIEALRVALAHVESEALTLGSLEPVRERTGRRSLQSVAEPWSSGPQEVGPCSLVGAARVAGTVVSVFDAQQGGDPLLRLTGSRIEQPRPRSVPRHEAVVGSRIRIDGHGVEGMEVMVESVDQQIIAVVDADGCLVLPSLPPGNHVLRPLTDGHGTGPIDTAHRTGDALRLDVSLFARPLGQAWRLSQPVDVTVHLDPSAGRPPDVVRPDPLRWMVRGDDARIATGLGAARPLHPGSATVVVSACRNPDAFASSVTVVVPSGGELVAAVPLATVTLRGLAGRSDDVVEAVRTTDCADGSGLRPSIRWEGGLTEGLQVALPHGEWEVWLETTTGTRLTATVVVRAGAGGAEVTFP